ncbi:MAG TPA: bifunctional metallophosphatase/5'-nucleotidase [Novosphingobium sp.]
MKRLAALLAPALLAACAAPMASRESSAPVTAAPVAVGVIAINDFHGSLAPPRQSVFMPDGKGGTIGVPAGGAAWLASAIDSIRGKYANHLTVSAGDLISASQLASSLYLDEPTIGVMNRIGLEFNAVGNHEFDRGWQELLRMQEGGCVRYTTRQPCQLEPFKGASFHFLSASTTRADGTTLFPATGMKSFGSGRAKVSVGVIGLTLKGTPDLVSPDGIKGLAFGDEANAINAAVPRLKAQGADAVVVLIHQGGRTAAGSDPSGCKDFAGDIRPILDQLDPRVDVVVSGHTHWPYVCDYGALNPSRPFLLTSAGVYGELVTDITLTIDPARHRVTAKRAANVIVQSQPYVATRGPVPTTDIVPRFMPRADIAEFVGRYMAAASAYAERPAGTLLGAAEKTQSSQGGPLGNLIADAQLGATRAAGAQIALMNPFGIRASLVPGADNSVTYGMLYAVQPFNNQLVTQTLTGAELKQVLEQSFSDSGPEQFLTPSVGFTYTIDRAAPAGGRISAMMLDGRPIDPAASYRVTTSAFLAGGGDGFSVLAKQRDATTGATDIDALETWLKTAKPRSIPVEPRVIEAPR